MPCKLLTCIHFQLISQVAQFVARKGYVNESISYLSCQIFELQLLPSLVPFLQHACQQQSKSKKKHKKKAQALNNPPGVAPEVRKLPTEKDVLLEFGLVAVFSCECSCSSSPGCFEEYVWAHSGI